MRITAGLGASACLALALAGCADNCGVKTVDCPAAPPLAVTQSATLPAVARGPIIAVMPFIGVGDAPASGFLVAEVMARRLQEGGGCAVVRPEALTARAGLRPGEELDPVDAGRKAGAHYVVMGRVTDYAVGDGTDNPRVGLTVRLLETKSGTVVWTGDGLKSAGELPEGGLDALAFAACGNLAKTIHDSVDMSVVVAMDAAAKAEAEANRTAAAATPAAPKPQAAAPAVAEAPVPPSEVSEAPVTVVTTRAADTPKSPAGEGTADWAVPLEDMPGYLESVGAPALAADETAADEEVLAVLPATEGVGSVLGMEKEEDMTGSLLIPGAVTIDFPDENVRPEDFGVQVDAQAAVALSSPEPVGEVLGSTVARKAEKAEKAEALPRETPAELSVEPGLTDLPVSPDGGEDFDEKFSVDNIDLGFFETLSESLEKETGK